MSTVHYWNRQILSLNSNFKVILMKNSWSCQTASQKNNDYSVKRCGSKSFPFDTKTCRYPHTIFHSENKKSKEWLEIMSTSAPQSGGKFGCLHEIWCFQNVFIVTHTEWDNTNQNSLKCQAQFQNGLLDLNRTTCIMNPKWKNSSSVIQMYPSVCAVFFVFVKIISDKSRSGA